MIFFSNMGSIADISQHEPVDSGEKKGQPVFEPPPAPYHADDLQRHFCGMLDLLRNIFFTHDSLQIKPHLLQCIQSVEEMLRLVVAEESGKYEHAVRHSVNLKGGGHVNTYYPRIAFLDHMHRFIDDHIHEPGLDISALARALNMSNSNLYRKIRTVYRMSASAFLTAYKMNHAAGLLASGSYSVKEVSAMIGFKDARYFSTCFKKHFNLTPTAYICHTRDKNTIL